MKKIILSAIGFAALSMVSSCKTDFDRDVQNVSVSSGSASFAKYVAIGNSLTSGYRDGALYIDGQNESYPSIIAQQMARAGGGTFTQPMMPNNTGGFTDLFAASGGTDFYGKLTLSVAGGSFSPNPSAPGANLDIIGGAGKYFNNMGVPGAKSYHLVAAGYGNPAYLSLGKANPYFVRFATSATTSVLADAVAQKPTFYSLWIGSNDVLSYATSGGSGVDRTGNLDPTTYGSNDISDPNVVKSVINSVISTLKTAGSTKGVIANIPYVTTIPYFTTVPAQPIAGLTSAQVSALMGATAYGGYNAGLAQAKALGYLSAAEYQQRLISFTAGAVANGAVIVDKDLTNLSALGIPSYRQTTASDLILLPAASVLKTGGGTSTALADKYVLTSTEAARVKTATDAYNTAIASLATTYGLAFMDANAAMAKLNSNSGIVYDAVKYTAAYVTGGAFSLDGVHPNGRGYAIIANEYIKAINNTYYSTLPLVNPNNYTGVSFP